MAKSAVLDLVRDLSHSQADESIFESLYEEASFEVARSGLFSAIELVEIVGEAPEYDEPAGSVGVLRAFYDDRELHEARKIDLEAARSNWRDDRGTPVAFVQEDLSRRRFRLYPVPLISSKDFSFILGSPMGADFPEYSVAVLFNAQRVDWPEWLNLPLALRIVAKEFSRDSAHRDLTFAETCLELAKRMFVLVT